MTGTDIDDINVRRHEELAERIKQATVDTVYHLRHERIKRVDAHQEVLEFIENAPTELANYLDECVRNQDMQDLLATISDIINYGIDQKARGMVEDELGV